MSILSDHHKFPSVAVIGAGIAGLSAAKTLMQKGVNVTLFEKSRGLGGRASTRRLPWANIELGVQYFTVQTPEFSQQVSKWLQQKHVAQWMFIPHIFTGDSLTESPDQQKRMVAMPNMHALYHDIAQSIPIMTSQKVVELVPHQQGWQLITEKGQFEYFDWVVSAIPCEQAQPLVNPHSGLLQNFEAPHRSVWAVVLATKGHIPRSVQGVFCQGDMRWISRASAKPGFLGKDTFDKGNTIDDVWILHFDEGWSENMGKNTGHDKVIEYAYYYLQKLLRCTTDAKISLIHSDAHFWRYAQMNKSSVSPMSILNDGDKKLSVIGAWCGGGRFEEGYMSGISAANAIFRKIME